MAVAGSCPPEGRWTGPVHPSLLLAPVCQPEQVARMGYSRAVGQRPLTLRPLYPARVWTSERPVHGLWFSPGGQGGTQPAGTGCSPLSEEQGPGTGTPTPHGSETSKGVGPAQGPPPLAQPMKVVTKASGKGEAPETH